MRRRRGELVVEDKEAGGWGWAGGDVWWSGSLWRGQVFGGYIPAAGLPVDVEYRDGRRWRMFDSTRARAQDGRFVYHYTFKRTTVPIVYTFRVVIPVSGVSGYPYESTGSRPRSVRVDP